jgi:F-type H+-transporting ATPase subunit epsilon
MNLSITTPLQVLVDDDAVVSLRAEDASGNFGILAGHADFLTALSVSVVRWTDVGGAQHYCAVRLGVLTVEGGARIAIATREAVVGDDLMTLDQDVLRRFRDELETQRVERVASAQLQMNAVRQIMQRLRRQGVAGSGNFA